MFMFYFLYTKHQVLLICNEIKKFLLPIGWYNRGSFPLGIKHFVGLHSEWVKIATSDQQYYATSQNLLWLYNCKFVVCLAEGCDHMRVVLLGTHHSARRMLTCRSFDNYFNLSPIYHLYVLFVEISYLARFSLHISHPAIIFTMLIGFLNYGSFLNIVHALLPGTSKALTLSVFLLGASVHIPMPDIQWVQC